MQDVLPNLTYIPRIGKTVGSNCKFGGALQIRDMQMRIVVADPVDLTSDLIALRSDLGPAPWNDVCTALCLSYT